MNTSILAFFLVLSGVVYCSRAEISKQSPKILQIKSLEDFQNNYEKARVDLKLHDLIFNIDEKTSLTLRTVISQNTSGSFQDQ